MTPTNQAVRRAAMLGVFAAVLLATGTPRTAGGHDATDGTFHLPEPPRNLRVQGIVAGSVHGIPVNAVIASWEAGHSHQDSPFALTGYRLTLGSSPLPATCHREADAFILAPERCLHLPVA